MDELDLSQINQIDTECAAPDDDDTLILKPSKVNAEFVPNTTGEDRPVVTKLGIFADFSDDEPVEDQKIEIVELPTLAVGAGKASSVEQEILNAQNGVLTPSQIDRADLDGINVIDTECSVGEDDDMPVSTQPRVSLYNSSPKVLDFGDEENEVSFDRDLLEKRTAKSPEKRPDGSVDADYWKKLQKKFNSANKKSMMGPTHGHWCHDPKMEMDMFNHDNTPSTSSPVVPTAGQLGSAGAGQGGSMVDGGLPSLGEDLTPTEATEKFKDTLAFMDYKVIPGEDGGYTLQDEIEVGNNKSFKTIDELLNILHEECNLDLYLSEELKDVVENHREDIQLSLL